jgi:SAM-dependent methyltransferase
MTSSSPENLAAELDTVERSSREPVLSRAPSAREDGSPGAQMVYVQVGCANTAPPGWINFDANPRVLLPFWRGPYPPNVRYANVTRLPLADNSVDMLFASHVLEHLARDEFETALGEAHRVLKPGGRFRLIVPDLQERARRYLQSGSERANDEFMRSTWLGTRSRPRGLFAWVKRQHSLAGHLWMWDRVSMSAALGRHGFRHIRPCTFADSGDPMLALVEREDRFVNADGIREVGIEAVK